MIFSFLLSFVLESSVLIHLNAAIRVHHRWHGWEVSWHCWELLLSLAQVSHRHVGLGHEHERIHGGSSAGNSSGSSSGCGCLAIRALTRTTLSHHLLLHRHLLGKHGLILLVHLLVYSHLLDQQLLIEHHLRIDRLPISRGRLAILANCRHHHWEPAHERLLLLGCSGRSGSCSSLSSLCCLSCFSSLLRFLELSGLLGLLFLLFLLLG